MKQLLIPIFIFLSILFTGCYTTGRFRMINIEVLQPAAIFENNPEKIIAAIYNNNNTTMDSTNCGFIYNAEILFDTINTDSLASRIYFNSFVETLRKEHFLDTVVRLEGFTNKTGNDSIYFYSKNEIDSLKSLNNSGTMFSLDLFSINEIAYTHNIYNETGIVIIFKAIWSIYTSSSDTNKFVIHSDTITYVRDYATFNTRKTILQDRINLIDETSVEMGTKFASYFVPHWEEVQRMYYLSGNPLFVQANKLAIENKWFEAAKIWKNLTENGNKNIVAKSMFNLAVACEMEGKYDVALDWAIKSFQVFGQKNTMHAHNCLDYIRILSTRNLEIKKLQEQLQSEIIK
ncbi:MAG: hypothetical protein JW833_07340 [Prolixibacteraceae bacterium]|nr:hypothetical protein [Prolixibacteraceae bacterium]